MIKYLVLISYLLITNNLYSKIPLLIDSISYENERAAIDTFVHNFRTETDSIRLQKYICFPEFSIRSGCMLPRRGLVLSKMSDRQIRKYISKYPSDDPFYYWRLKYDADNRFRKHLELNNISIEEYCYRDEQCRIAMCGYLIRHFKFSEKCQYLRYLENYPMKGANKAILEINCNYTIGIIKSNNEYKVLYISFLCD